MENGLDIVSYKIGKEHGGVQPTGEIDITQNGITNVSGYATANVQVPEKQLEDKKQVSVYEIQDIVEKKLMGSSRKEVAQNYITYRYNRDVARKAKTRDIFLDIIGAKANDITRENANMNADTPAGMMMKFASETTKPFVDDFLLSPEARENQLISLAVDLVEKRLLDGSASSQETTHFLKLATSKAKLEKEILEKQKELITAKTEALQSQKRMEELYANAIKAMNSYNGRGGDEDDY